MARPKSRPRTAKRDRDNPDRALISPELADELFKAYRAAAQWEAKLESIRAEVEQLAGDAGEIYDTDGRPVVLGRVIGKSTRFDQAAFAKDHPELFETYKVTKANSKPTFKPAVEKLPEEDS